VQWEYEIEEIVLGQQVENIVEQLNELGDGGWEAVAVFPSSKSNGQFFVLLKKPKQSK
jgi:hypothetical protein